MKKMQKEILPNCWMQCVDCFRIDTSDLSQNNKIIAKYLIKLIKQEKGKSLTILLLRSLIEYIIFGSKFVFVYDDLPINLIEEGFSEIHTEKSLDLTRKLHSLTIEFQTYQNLRSEGYQIKHFNRKKGSCDLTMSKGGKTFDCEVKFKESKDTALLRLYDYIDGFSLLPNNGFLRNNSFGIELKIKNPNYKETEQILKEIDEFILKQQGSYDGTYVRIDNTRKNISGRDVDSVIQNINKDAIRSVEDVDGLICKIFIKNNGHLTKLIKKSGGDVKNFIGCLSWSIPFHIIIDKHKIEQAFKAMGLDFDLYVYIAGINIDNFTIFIPKKK